MARAPYRIHVNRHIVAANRRHGRNEPPLKIFRGRYGGMGHEIEILDSTGSVVARLIHRPEKPLKCGATIWLEAQNARVVV